MFKSRCQPLLHGPSHHTPTAPQTGCPASAQTLPSLWSCERQHLVPVVSISPLRMSSSLLFSAYYGATHVATLPGKWSPLEIMIWPRKTVLQMCRCLIPAQQSWSVLVRYVVTVEITGQSVMAMDLLVVEAAS